MCESKSCDACKGSIKLPESPAYAHGSLACTRIFTATNNVIRGKIKQIPLIEPGSDMPCGGRCFVRFMGRLGADVSHKRDSGACKGLYVIGPVTGFEDGNVAAFEEARAKLAEAGYGPVGIPHDDILPGTPWDQAMRMSLSNMLMYFERPNGDCSDLEFDCFEYDGIAMLDGWSKSDGATMEHMIAGSVGMPCMTVDQWCSLAEDAHHDES